MGVGRRLITSIREDDVSGLGAEIAYRFLFAIFPFGIFVAALTAFVAQAIGLADPTGQIIGAVGDNLPADVANGIRPQLEAVIGTTRPGLLTVGAIAALWAATGGTNALIKAMNRAYEVEETRPLIPRYATAIGLTLLASIGILVAFVTIVGASLLTTQVVDALHLDPAVVGAISLVRWPIVFVGLSVAVAVLYKLAPNFRAPWRWCLAGGAIFSVGWLLATALFGLYVANFANYSNTYGALGGVVVLMLWFYLSSIVLVGAAALVASAMKELRPDTFAAGQEVAKAAATEAADAHASASPTALPAPVAPSGPAPRATSPARSANARRHTPVAHTELGTHSWPLAGAAIVAGLAIGTIAARLLGRDDP